MSRSNFGPSKKWHLWLYAKEEQVESRSKRHGKGEEFHMKKT